VTKYQIVKIDYCLS